MCSWVLKSCTCTPKQDDVLGVKSPAADSLLYLAAAISCFRLFAFSNQKCSLVSFYQKCHYLSQKQPQGSRRSSSSSGPLATATHLRNAPGGRSSQLRRITTESNVWKGLLGYTTAVKHFLPKTVCTGT